MSLRNRFLWHKDIRTAPNKRMKTDRSKRYAVSAAADAERYEAHIGIIKKAYWTVGFLALFSACGVYYWQVRYLLEAGNPGRQELQIGAALVALYSWPAWIGFPAYSLWFRKALNRASISLSLLPAVLICAPFVVIASFGHAS